jgi:GAF domain-containing protein
MNQDETTAPSDLLPCDPQGGMDTAGGSRDALTSLRRAQQLMRDAQAAVEEASRVMGQEPTGGNSAGMQARLAAAESERQALSTRLHEVEHQVGRMMTLYVASYQLHASLDPVEVQSTVAEIALNLIGAEQFVLILRDDEDKGYEVRLNEGDVEAPWARSLRYLGGDPLIDAALTDGELRFGPDPGSPVLAVVPLRVQDVSIGALAILKLLSHKPALVKEDHDLLDLLGAHAASAIFASRVYAKTARKLRTLEGLMKLVNQG